MCFETQRPSTWFIQRFSCESWEANWQAVKICQSRQWWWIRGHLSNTVEVVALGLRRRFQRPHSKIVYLRMNRTICDRIRCMLSHAKLPKSFWGEAMRITVDLNNLSPSYLLEGDIPKRIWTRKFIFFEHLRVFGCKAFVHVLRDEWSKLDTKTKQCIFLGYSNEEFGYRLWDPTTKKIIRSRDVVFFEDQTIEDLDQVKKPKPFSEE